MNDATNMRSWTVFRRRAAALAAIIAALCAVCGPFAAPPRANAQAVDATSLTITPPFFTINVSPGDVWTSSIRVVNTNQGNLPVVATVMGFRPTDSKGHGMFIRLSSLASDTDALANWITVSPSSAVVPPDGAVDIPFSITVPRNASPGGHYAGILIGTQPLDATGTMGVDGSHIGISSFISALIFVTVSGDIKEAGAIQEFATDKPFYQHPNVDFSVLFANTGNVHVRPVGQIQIYNMFGKEVGTVPINQEGDLGYVLPSSTREFDEQWQGPGNLLDIGQFTAILTLAYGTDGTKSVSQSLTFWVLPVGQLVEDALILLLIVGAFIFFLRRYVRKMLEREMGHYGPRVASPPPGPRQSGAGKSAKKDRSDDIVDLRR